MMAMTMTAMMAPMIPLGISVSPDADDTNPCRH
jgi:hypothetical protein